MPVVSAFRQLPRYGCLASTWVVILAESLDITGNAYRVCRVRRAGAAGQWEVTDSPAGAQSLSWIHAALWFARIVAIEAAPPDDPPLQQDQHPSSPPPSRPPARRQ